MLLELSCADRFSKEYKFSSRRPAERIIILERFSNPLEPRQLEAHNLYAIADGVPPFKFERR